MSGKWNTILLALFISTGAYAQGDKQAQAILEDISATYHHAACTKILFDGSQKGSLLLQDNCFIIDCAGIKSWYDGHTQWSYIKQNEEVNISTPTHEELNTAHPYAWINQYNVSFIYKYAGQKTIDGKQVEEVILTPKQTSDIDQIILCVSKNRQPVFIELQHANGTKQKFTINSYQSVKKQDISVFRFNPKQYPKAEIIDLR